MRIRALRLSEVGPFRNAVAIEGFSGGLDVLLGPNELGKSTIFTALRTLLAERHTTTSQRVASLRPETGGAPLIEADVEINGRMLRLRKRYLSQRMAALQDLGSGEIWHGADAETALENLIGGDGCPALRGLLWVAQGESFELPRKPDATLAGALAALIEHEAADTAGAGTARRLADAVRARLETLVTLKQGRARTGGPLDTARRRRDELLIALEAARTKAATAQQRLDRHNALRAERELLSENGTAAVLAAKARAARSAVEEADKARAQLRLFDERVTARQLEHDRAQADLDRHLRLCTELQQIIANLDDGASRLVALRAQRSTLEAHLQAIANELATGEASHRELSRALAAAREHQRKAAAQAELARMDGRIATARAASIALAEAEDHLRSNPTSLAAIEGVRRLTSRLEALAARLEAEATWASIAYLPDAPHRIRIDGHELSDGARVRIDGPTEIVIDGVGTITLDGGRTEGPSLAPEHEACSVELARALSLMGASSLADAEIRLVARQRAEARAGEAKAQLAALAPAGLATLQAERDAIAARAGDGPVSAPPSDDDIVEMTQAVSELDAELSRKRATSSDLERQLRGVSVSMGQLEAQLAAAAQRRSDLERDFTSLESRASRQRELNEAVAQAASALTTAIRERSAWAEATPSSVAYDALVQAEAQARSEALRFTEQSTALERELATLEGALRRDGEEGIGAEVAALLEALEAAEARVVDLETDVDALTQIASGLERAGADHREQVLRPLVERLGGLLAPLLPGATLVMDGPLLAVSLERGDRTDPLGRISGGTREQIATLVRLAYADMMAARGRPMPLVLDDALAFSDDTRLGIMFGLLAAAARRHQVVVLSCHQRALAPLVEAQGAHTLSISAWREPAGTRTPIATRDTASSVVAADGTGVIG